MGGGGWESFRKPVACWDAIHRNAVPAPVCRASLSRGSSAEIGCGKREQPGDSRWDWFPEDGLEPTGPAEDWMWGREKEDSGVTTRALGLTTGRTVAVPLDPGMTGKGVGSQVLSGENATSGACGQCPQAVAGSFPGPMVPGDGGICRATGVPRKGSGPESVNVPPGSPRPPQPQVSRPEGPLLVSGFKQQPNEI